MSTHVPAWKRLGLKLKYAKEQADSASTAAPTNVRDHELDPSDRPVKRRRIVKNDADISPGQDGTHSSSDNPAQRRKPKETKTPNGSARLPDASAGSLNQPLQRKKSVTFSEETKQADGDTRTTIDFPAGSPGSTPKRSKKLPKDEVLESPTTTTNNDVNSSATNHDTTPTKKPSKLKTGKKSKASTKDKSSSALDYLTQHRSARDSWKFNKILDVWILNHALDVSAIPWTHVAALAGYIRGLPAKAGSRERLIKECKEALASSEFEGDTSKDDRDLFVHFVESQNGSLQDAARLQDFLKLHSRAAVLLWSLDETVSGHGTSSSAGQDALPVRKKKSRTSAPIDISSSSESDSDSDTSDDSSDSEAGDEATSSSGTSSEDKEDSTSSNGSSDSSSDDDDDSE